MSAEDYFDVGGELADMDFEKRERHNNRSQCGSPKDCCQRGDCRYTDGYRKAWEELSLKSDYELLNKCISIGESLDDFKPFPAYSIAQKLLYHGWRLTKKQRTAMLNCLAYRISDDEDDEEDYYSYWHRDDKFW